MTIPKRTWKTYEYLKKKPSGKKNRKKNASEHYGKELKKFFAKENNDC